jgi:hypothetical protein
MTTAAQTRTLATIEEVILACGQDEARNLPLASSTIRIVERDGEHAAGLLFEYRLPCKRGRRAFENCEPEAAHRRQSLQGSCLRRPVLRS